MSIFSKFKTYFVYPQTEPEHSEPEISSEFNEGVPLRKQSADSFELIFEDIIEADSKTFSDKINK